jgi:hypothetical protein
MQVYSRPVAQPLAPIDTPTPVKFADVKQALSKLHCMLLAELRRDGIELDKSELVDCLLDVWVKWQQGENTDLQLADISPRRK